MPTILLRLCYVLLFVTINGCFFFTLEGFEQSLFIFDDIFDASILLRLHENGLTGFPLIVNNIWVINAWLVVLISFLAVLLFVML